MLKIILFAAILFTIPELKAGNLQLIEESPINDFAIYRTGKPDAKDMAEFCRLGISEIMVLSGDAAEAEVKYASSCPSLKVIYNIKQDADVPVSAQFLSDFDKWVLKSQI